ncbi:MAG: hypothetical protein JW856_00635 [Dehalococcoidales bacterium]|nr:hypothetical protein [Dehalococcoidales bacterium]
MNSRNYRTGFMITLVLTLVGILASVIFFVQLNSTKNTLDATKSQLSTSKTELLTAETNLATVVSNLFTTENLLTATQTNLTITKDNLTAARNTLATTQSNLEVARTQVSSLQNDLVEAMSQIDNLQTNIDRMSSSYGYVLNDPTYASLLAFLASDTTDEHSYIKDAYVCWNFTSDVITNAAKQHIRCAFVYIEYPDSAHAIIAFNTTDKGIVYIEPQTDEVVQLKVGVHYYQCVIPEAGYYYGQPSYDDTVKKFCVIW